MAGHSKWANIQHRKGAQDAKRGKLFTKLIREITVAARLGGADLDGNPRLRAAVDKGLGANMTKETIGRAIKKGSGDIDGENYFEIRYEGYGPNGLAVMVDCLTDNKNRTVAEVRHAFNKCGGSLGTDGSVAYLFSKQGIISYLSAEKEDEIMETALDAGAEDIINVSDDAIDVITGEDDFLSIKSSLIENGLLPDHAEVTMQASTSIDLNLEQAQKMMRLVDMLEELDDVQNVYSNGDVSDDVLKQL